MITHILRNNRFLCYSLPDILDGGHADIDSSFTVGNTTNSSTPNILSKKHRSAVKTDVNDVGDQQA